MDDELAAQFERQSERDKADLVAGDGEQYEAFNVVDRVQISLYLRPVGEPYQWVPYNYLLQILASPAGDRIDLVFSYQLVTITGRYLLAVGSAIAKRRCEFVQQFDPKKWPQPKDDSAPFIASIKYKMSTPSDLAG